LRETAHYAHTVSRPRRAIDALEERFNDPPGGACTALSWDNVDPS